MSTTRVEHLKATVSRKSAKLHDAYARIAELEGALRNAQTALNHAGASCESGSGAQGAAWANADAIDALLSKGQQS